MLWHGKTGKNLGHVDTNQLKNNMAAVSPNGRFIAAAAFTADVKVGILNCLVYTIMFNDQRGNLAGQFSLQLHIIFSDHITMYAIYSCTCSECILIVFWKNHLHVY